MRLKDKVIIVKGSTTGIGKAIALRCVEEGAHVILHGLEQDLGEEVLTEIGNDKAVLLIEDISSEGAPQRLVELAFKKFGQLDAVVNNAGMVVSSNIHTTDLTFFRKVLEVNSLAPFAMNKAALPHLTKTHGCVLNIGSVNAYSGEPNLLP
jgi:NAD(P)-dependent dehydrogenase (short-subunit alcohol dehydrogenase family)